MDKTPTNLYINKTILNIIERWMEGVSKTGEGVTEPGEGASQEEKENQGRARVKKRELYR